MKKQSPDTDQQGIDPAEELERLRIVFNSMNDAVFLAPIGDDGVHGNFVDVNETTCRRLGYTREELLGFNARSINPRANEQKIRAFGRTILANRLARFEAIHRAKDGTMIPVAVTAKLVEIGGKKYVLSLVADLRERKQLENEVARFGYLIEHMWDEIYIFSLEDHKLQLLNHAALDNLGYRREDVDQLSFTEIFHDLDRKSLDGMLSKLANGEDSTIRLQSEARRSDGTVYPVEVHLQLSHNEVPPVCLANVQDISERRQAEERVQWLANHDSMTGLANRTLFLDRLAVAMEQARRQEHLLAVIYLDIDNFKFINDSLGHHAGDQLIMEMGRRLVGCVRKTDTVSRLGGDEFTLLLTNVHNVSDVSRVLEKIQCALKPGITLNDQEFSLGASMGVTMFPFEDADDLGTILRQADSAMYNAKRSGKNRYAFYSRRLAEEEQRRSRLVNGLRKAIDRGELQVWYQPRVELETGRIRGAEALLRWLHPEMGMVMPEHFVEILESSGDIDSVGAWVFETACRQLQSWTTLQPGLKMAVNFSSRQFNDPGLVDMLQQAMTVTGTPAGQMEMEITEGLLLSGNESAVRILQRIRDLGISIALDDFGKGYSSLNYLKQFPIDVIKIDRSFTKDIETDRYSCIIIETLLQLARKLDLSVTAEGIETKEQADRLRYFGCPEGQGYLYGHPMRAQEFTTRLKAQCENYGNIITLTGKR